MVLPRTIVTVRGKLYLIPFSGPSAMSGAVGVPPVYGVGLPSARAAYPCVGFGQVEVEQAARGDAEPFGDLLDTKVPFAHRRNPAMRLIPPDVTASAATVHAGHARTAPAAAASASPVAASVSVLFSMFRLSLYAGWRGSG